MTEMQLSASTADQSVVKFSQVATWAGFPQFSSQVTDCKLVKFSQVMVPPEFPIETNETDVRKLRTPQVYAGLVFT